MHALVEGKFRSLPEQISVPHGFFQDFKLIDQPKTFECETDIFSGNDLYLPSTSACNEVPVHEEPRFHTISSDDDFEDEPQRNGQGQLCTQSSSDHVSDAFLKKWNDSWKEAVSKFGTTGSRHAMEKVLDRLGRLKLLICLIPSYIRGVAHFLYQGEGRVKFECSQPQSLGEELDYLEVPQQ